MDDLIKYWILSFLNLVLGVLDVFLDAVFGKTVRGGSREER